MNKNIVLGISAILLLALLTSNASAYVSWYGYDSGTSNEHYEKSSCSYDGCTYINKQVSESPNGKVVHYTQVKDYLPSSSYQNDVSTYWAYGPNYVKGYVNYDYSDDYRRSYYGTQYHPYFYQASREPRGFYGSNWYSYPCYGYYC